MSEEPDDPFEEYRETDRPGPPIPEPPDGNPSAELRRGFWGLVAVFNIAFFAIALGVLLLIFRDITLINGVILAFGLATFLYGLYRYHAYRTGKLPE